MVKSKIFRPKLLFSSSSSKFYGILSKFYRIWSTTLFFFTVEQIY